MSEIVRFDRVLEILKTDRPLSDVALLDFMSGEGLLDYVQVEAPCE